MEESRNITNTGYEEYELTELSSKQSLGCRVIQIGNLFGMKDNPMWGRIYDPQGLAPTLSTMQGGYRVPMIAVRANTKKGYTELHEGGGA